MSENDTDDPLSRGEILEGRQVALFLIDAISELVDGADEFPEETRETFRRLAERQYDSLSGEFTVPEMACMIAAVMVRSMRLQVHHAHIGLDATPDWAVEKTIETARASVTQTEPPNLIPPRRR